MSKGRVVNITGPVVDIEFGRGQLPEILNAIKIEKMKAENRLRLRLKRRFTLVITSFVA